MRVEGALSGGGGWLSLRGGCPTIREKGKGWMWGAFPVEAGWGGDVGGGKGVTPRF